MSKRDANDGRYVDDYILEDGESVRVPLTMCDITKFSEAQPIDRLDVTTATVKNAPRGNSKTAPGGRFGKEVVVPDQVRDVVRSALDDYIGNRGASGLPDVARDAARSARDDYVRNLTSAWDRRRKRDEDDPDYDPGDLEEEGDRALDRDPRARAIAARDAYVERLRNAWRTRPRDAALPGLSTRPEELAVRATPQGRTDPAAAGAIESALEVTRGSPPSLDERERNYLAYKQRLDYRSRPGLQTPQAAIIGAGPAALIAAVASPDPRERERALAQLGRKG